MHRAETTAMKSLHAAERQQERDAQGLQRQSITLAQAKAALSAERVSTPRPFHQEPAQKDEPQVEERAPQPTVSAVGEAFKDAARAAPPAEANVRAEEIKRDMEAWRQENGDKDFGREL